MTDLTETDITVRLKRLEERVLRGPINTPDEVTGAGGGAANRTLNIPTTNLADTEEIRQWLYAPAGVTTTVLATTLLNEAGQAPTGLDVYVYDYDNSTELYRDGSTYNEPTDLTLTEGAVHYLAVENATGSTQNANAVLAMEEE